MAHVNSTHRLHFATNGGDLEPTVMVAERGYVRSQVRGKVPTLDEDGYVRVTSKTGHRAKNVRSYADVVKKQGARIGAVQGNPCDGKAGTGVIYQARNKVVAENRFAPYARFIEEVEKEVVSDLSAFIRQEAAAIKPPRTPMGLMNDEVFAPRLFDESYRAKPKKMNDAGLLLLAPLKRYFQDSRCNEESTHGSQSSRIPLPV